MVPVSEGSSYRESTVNLKFIREQFDMTSWPLTCVLYLSKLFTPSHQIIIHASGVLDFLLDRTALWVGGLRKVGIDFAILDYIEWLGFRCESSRASF